MPARKPAELKYPVRQYTVYSFRIGKGLDESTARKEYTRIRSILNKRIQRIQESDFAGQGITSVFPEGLPKLSDIAPKDFPYLLQQAAQAIGAESASLKGLQRRAESIAETLREKGLVKIDRTNIAHFGRFMEEARERGLDKIYGSDQIAFLYNDLASLNIRDLDAVFNDFDFWLENIDDVENLPKRKVEKVSVKQLRKMLEG